MAKRAKRKGEQRGVTGIAVRLDFFKNISGIFLSYQDILSVEKNQVKILNVP